MRILPTLALASTISCLVTIPAEAYNCVVPPFGDRAKATVCGDSKLKTTDKMEQQRYTALRNRLGGTSRIAFAGDRKNFAATRSKCAADRNCLDATYRAQHRLYNKLSNCKAGASELACVKRTIDQHREELHRSM